MKSPSEIEEKQPGTDADTLRRRYLQLNDRLMVKNTEKKGDLLTPFLLSIPVIIMLIILMYSL